MRASLTACRPRRPTPSTPTCWSSSDPDTVNGAPGTVQHDHRPRPSNPMPARAAAAEDRFEAEIRLGRHAEVQSVHLVLPRGKLDRPSAAPATAPKRLPAQLDHAVTP